MYKKGDKCTCVVSIYRPISLTSVVIETIKCINILSIYNLLHGYILNHQYGFHKHCSTTHLFLMIGLELHQSCHCLFLDLSFQGFGHHASFTLFIQVGKFGNNWPSFNYSISASYCQWFPFQLVASYFRSTPRLNLEAIIVHPICNDVKPACHSILLTPH